MASAEVDETDIQAVVEVLRSGRLALGPKVDEFERHIAEYVGVEHAVAVNSGTAALHLIMCALGIGPGDEVLVPSFTFAASVNVILFVGATPVFVDVEPDTYNIAPADLASKTTRRTRAILAVDVFGHPADWDEILQIADKHGLRVIDDSCEALGAAYRGRKLGTFGDAAAFAFYPNKQITTGEGGILVTNNGRMAEIARSLRNQGRSHMGGWLEHERLGYNYRMDEMSAALGVSQLKRIESFLEKRELVARLYQGYLSEFGWLQCPTVRPDVRMSWFCYVVKLAEGLERDAVIVAMEERGVPTRGYFAPIHQQPYIKELEIPAGELPVTENIAHRTLALPFHPNMTPDEVGRVAEALFHAVRGNR